MFEKIRFFHYKKHLLFWSRQSREFFEYDKDNELAIDSLKRSIHIASKMAVISRSKKINPNQRKFLVDHIIQDVQFYKVLLTEMVPDYVKEFLEYILSGTYMHDIFSEEEDIINIVKEIFDQNNKMFSLDKEDLKIITADKNVPQVLRCPLEFFAKDSMEKEEAEAKLDEYKEEIKKWVPEIQFPNLLLQSVIDFQVEIIFENIFTDPKNRQ